MSKITLTVVLSCVFALGLIGVNEYWEHQEKAKWDRIDRETAIDNVNSTLKRVRKQTETLGGPKYEELVALESHVNALVRQVAKDGGLPVPDVYRADDRRRLPW